MKKKMVVAAIATTLAAPTVVNAEATMYGQVRVATQYHSRGDFNDSWGMEDHQSRVGVKGEEDLGGGLKGIFQLEFGVNVGEGLDSSDTITGTGQNTSLSGRTGRKSDKTWSQRDSFVGLAGPFGTVLAGRHDTPLKMTTLKLDFFRDTNVDNDDQGSFIKPFGTRGVGLFDSLRVDGAIAYVSPNLAGLTLMGAIVQTKADAYFDDADSGMGAYSLAATYSNGPWFASAAYESLQPDNLGIETSLSQATGAAVNSLPDYNKWRLAVGMLDFNNISASFIYEDRTDTFFGALGESNSSSWQLSAAYDIMGMLRVKGMYGQYLYDYNDETLFDTWAIGLEHKFSKRTDVQVLYRQKKFDKDIAGTDDARDNVFAVQLDHAF